MSKKACNNKSLDTKDADTRPDLTPAARRALAEAEARRMERHRKHDADQSQHGTEIGGRDGPDPVRYGDWEHGGIISDF